VSGSRRSGKVIGYCLDDGPVVEPNLALQHLGSLGEDRIALEETANGLEGDRLRLIQIVGHDENLIRRLLGIGPPNGDTGADSGLAALLRLRVDVRRIGQLALRIKREGTVEYVPLGRDEAERLPGLVLGDESVEELDDPAWGEWVGDDGGCPAAFRGLLPAAGVNDVEVRPGCTPALLSTPCSQA
jgi:hypothetical protein